MKSPLRILYLEDDPRDAELVQETLAIGGIRCHVTRVETEADFIASLEQGGFDLILADYTLPSFDGLSALKIAQQDWPHVPLIFVSGTLGEEVAIEALKIGATDYVFKTRLSRIVPSVQRALREAEERIGPSRAEEALRRSEAYLAEAQRLSHTGSFGWDVASGEIYWSLETFRIFEYEPATSVTVEMVVQRAHPDDRSAVEQLIERVSREKAKFDFEHRLLMPDGSIKYLRIVGCPSEGGPGRSELVGAVTALTERKLVEKDLRRSEECLLEAQRMSHTGSWGHDIASGKVTVSPEIYRIFDIKPGEDVSSAELYFNRVHPEDRKRVQEVFENSEIQKTPYQADYRIVLPSGTIKYIHSVGHPSLNESGDLVEFVGTSMDVTEA